MSETVPLTPGKYYHVYNRGNDRENLFREERNYAYFLKQYSHHVFPVVDTYAYCLMRNHFHLLIRIKSMTEDCSSVRDADLSGQASRCFSNFFNAYTKAFNLTYQRTGALFQRPFRRIEVTSESYLYRLVAYIHQNPQHHRFVADFRDWPYSSYHALLSERPTRLKREEVLDWFRGRDNMDAMHRESLPQALVDALAPGDRTWGD